MCALEVTFHEAQEEGKFIDVIYERRIFLKKLLKSTKREKGKEKKRNSHKDKDKNLPFLTIAK